MTRRHIGWIGFSLAIATFAPGCGSNAESGERTLGADPGIIGAEGGEVRSPDGLASVEVAPAAERSEFELSVAQAADVPAGAQGRAYEIAFEGVSSVEFTVRLSYAELSNAVSAEQLRVARVVDDRWSELPAPVLDEQERVVSAAASSAGVYALVSCASCGDGGGIVVGGTGGGSGGSTGGGSAGSTGTGTGSQGGTSSGSRAGG